MIPVTFHVEWVQVTNSRSLPCLFVWRFVTTTKNRKSWQGLQACFHTSFSPAPQMSLWHDVCSGTSSQTEELHWASITPSLCCSAALLSFGLVHRTLIGSDVYQMQLFSLQVCPRRRSRSFFKSTGSDWILDVIKKSWSHNRVLECKIILVPQ